MADYTFLEKFQTKYWKLNALPCFEHVGLQIFRFYEHEQLTRQKFGEVDIFSFGSRCITWRISVFSAYTFLDC